MSQHNPPSRKDGLLSRETSLRSVDSEDTLNDNPSNTQPARDDSVTSDLKSSDGRASSDDSLRKLKIMKIRKPQLGRPPTHLWTPLALKSFTLFGFVALFAILLLALEALYQVDGRRQGLSTASTRDRYLWSYGPTTSKNRLYPLSSLALICDSICGHRSLLGSCGLLDQTTDPMEVAQKWPQRRGATASC
jgi:hypothetical protein